jgi:thiamine biosynthesis lipoprotein
MRRRSKLLFAILATVAFSTVPSFAQSDSLRFEVKASKYLMGTQVDATVMYGDILAARKRLVLAFREMERIEGVLSAQRDTSEISRLNREASSAPIHVSRETFDILQRAKAYSARLGGLFDVTVGSLSELWGFSGPGEAALPPDSAIETARATLGCSALIFNDADTTVYFGRKGMKVDLGGIAKGYAVDRAAAVLRRYGIDDFIINAGGDLYVSGEKMPGEPWTVGIKHPRRTSDMLATLKIGDAAVVTSGDYERYFIQDGRRYHHILDPRTGYPASESRSVTVIADSAEEADALATWLFVLGDGPPPSLPVREPVLRVDAAGALHYSEELWQPYDLEIQD